MVISNTSTCFGVFREKQQQSFIFMIKLYVFLVAVSILQAKVSLKYATGGSLNIQFPNLLTLTSILNFEWSNYFVQQKSNADLNWFGCPC